MMLRWIWLVPPAILPPGAASMPDAPGPSTVLAGAAEAAAQHRRVEHQLGDPEFHQRRRSRCSRTLAQAHRLVGVAARQEPGELLTGDRLEAAAARRP